MKITLILASGGSPSAAGNQLDFSYLTWLINGASEETGRTSLMGCMPLALPTLAALTPPDVEVSIVDENVQRVDLDAPVDAVGISFLTLDSRRAYALADAFRQRGVHVVLGGIHASLFPEEAQAYADTVVVGEAEETWPRFIEDLRRGGPGARYQAELRPDLHRLVLPRWDLLKGRYYNLRHVQTTRGCKYACDFCAVRSFLGPPRHKPVENVVAEIEALRRYNKTPGMLRVAFADDNIVSSRAYATELFRALIPLNVRWSSQCSVDITDDDDLLTLAQDSGCESLLIGFESLSQQSLDDVNKGRVNRVDNFAVAIKRLHAHKIMVYPMIVLGLDGDDSTSFAQTARFMRETSAAFPVFNILTPIPGTRLFERLEGEDRILHQRWEEYSGASVCFLPRRMTPHELQDGFHWLLHELYAPREILTRMNRLWEAGVIRQEKSYLLLRAILTGRLLAELASRRPPPELAALMRQLLIELWRRPKLAISFVLVSLNFYEYASHQPVRG